MNSSPRVLVWNENWHETHEEPVRRLYPRGIHHAIADGLAEHGIEAQTATFDEPEHGLGDEVLTSTDVLVWWGHRLHEDVDDRVVARVRDRILAGMGLVALHSAQGSKLFTGLMGTDCTVNWRNDGERERVWVVEPGHPIAAGIGPSFVLEPEEMFGEPFTIPPPDELIFISWFTGGEVVRSGCTFRRGRGRIFYFRPGHQRFPTYHDATVRRVIANACRWVAPTDEIAGPPASRRQEIVEGERQFR